MNLIGKILVGVIFVMSIVFMSFSIVLYSTQHDWKDKYQKADADVKKVQADNSTLESRIAKLEDESKRLIAGLEEDKTKLQADNERLDKEVESLQGTMAQYQTAADNAVKLSTATQDLMLKQRDELLALRDQLATANTELHTRFEDFVAANNTARVLAMELASLKSTSGVLGKSLAEARYLLTQLGYGDLAPEVYDAQLLDIPPRVEGTITDVRQGGLVEINIGRDDGLLQGHKLHVYRDNEGVQTYLGRIEVLNVKPGKAVGKIMPEYRTGTIMQNDSVTAYLSQITASL